MFRFFRKNKFPKRIYDVWYNASVHCKDSEFPIVFDEEHRYIDCKIGLKVAMFRDDNGKLIYYRVTNIRSRYGDFIFQSDGIRCDLQRV